MAESFRFYQLPENQSFRERVAGLKTTNWNSTLGPAT